MCLLEVDRERIPPEKYIIIILLLLPLDDAQHIRALLQLMSVGLREETDRRMGSPAFTG